MENIIFLNHKEKQCGVYQYGKRSGEILQKSTKYNFIYTEVDCEDGFQHIVNSHNPIAIVYNYYSSTMPWLSHNSLARFSNQVHYLLHHEGGYPAHIPFTHYLMVDSTYHETFGKFAIPRPLLECSINSAQNTIPVISSFGFGFGNKGFQRLVRTVNEQFDEAIIRLHIPRSYYGDRDGNTSAPIISGSRDQNKKSKIKLEITTNFMNDQDVLQFLANSSLNAFLYDDMIRGPSSVIDYALNVNVPIAITKSDMFRHIKHASPSICVEDRSLSDIMNSGTQPLQQFREKWSHANFIKKYEQIIDKTRRQP